MNVFSATPTATETKGAATATSAADQTKTALTPTEKAIMAVAIQLDTLNKQPTKQKAGMLRGMTAFFPNKARALWRNRWKVAAALLTAYVAYEGASRYGQLPIRGGGFTYGAQNPINTGLIRSDINFVHDHITNAASYVTPLDISGMLFSNNPIHNCYKKPEGPDRMACVQAVNNDCVRIIV